MVPAYPLCRPFGGLHESRLKGGAGRYRFAIGTNNGDTLSVGRTALQGRTCISNAKLPGRTDGARSPDGIARSVAHRDGIRLLHEATPGILYLPAKGRHRRIDTQRLLQVVHPQMADRNRGLGCDGYQEQPCHRNESLFHRCSWFGSLFDNEFAAVADIQAPLGQTDLSALQVVNISIARFLYNCTFPNAIDLRMLVSKGEVVPYQPSIAA